MTWPEHCIDPMVIASHDVIVIGGPDTNFWHAALYEAVSRQFDVPGSSIPLAMGLRELRNGFPVYGSRSMLVSLQNPAGLPQPEGGVLEMDERLFPTYGMILACRNPFAAAVGISRWCVFVAGTRSLGTSGAVLGLAAILRQLRGDPGLNFSSTARTTRDGVHARVAAVLCRTSQVERAIVRRDGQILDRQRNELAPVGLVFGLQRYVPSDRHPVPGVRRAPVGVAAAVRHPGELTAEPASEPVGPTRRCLRGALSAHGPEHAPP